MKFNEYPEHRNSGIEWVGDVPAHWDILKGAWLGSLFGSETVPEEHVVDQGPLPFIKVSSLSVEGFNLMQKSYFVSESWYKSVKPRKNFVVFPKRGAAVFTNKVNIVRENAVIDPNLMGWEVNDRAIPEYIAHILKLRGLNDIADVSTVPQINNKHISPMMFPVPPLSEQYEIAKFLDYETAKIDALIAKQQQLIALLQEKRQAVISHAVTKGLNPAAPLRDSGVEWLGKVPAHWEVKKLGHVGELQNGLNIGGDAFGSGDPFVSYGDVYNNAIVPSLPTGLVQSTADDQIKYSLKSGDVLFTRTSETVDDIGVASTCLQEIPKVTFAGFLIRFRPVPGKLNPNYSSFLFRNRSIQDFFAGSMNLVTRASLSQNVLKTLPICVPPIDEQVPIAIYLKKTASVFDQLEHNLVRQEEILQERRTALIAAAVTGKIDVRGWQPPVANAAGAPP